MNFSSPPDPRAYGQKVYTVVRDIPAGRVLTYGQVARLIPPPMSMTPDQYLRLAPRWVGSAMAGCPDDVPWQRVINSQGKISARPGMGPLAQRNLLENEGVAFDDRDRVDLALYAWTPPADWLRENGLVDWTAASKPGPETPRLF